MDVRVFQGLHYATKRLGPVLVVGHQDQETTFVPPSAAPASEDGLGEQFVEDRLFVGVAMEDVHSVRAFADNSCQDMTMVVLVQPCRL